MKRGRNQRRRQGVNPNRALDSNGPDVRIRGTANQIYDKYQALARDAASSGDRVKAENYLQHAEHYFRLVRAAQQANQQQQQPHESDSEQPSVGDGDRDAQRENDRDQRQPRRARNGAADAEKDDVASESDAARSAKSETNSDGEEQKKPRRRRAPRKSAKHADAEENNEAGDDEPAAAAAE